jgi:glycosyltransferase involved in cell wall biosynthesis
MSKMPTISIITPSYNQGKFIERTIQSVLAQGYPSLELIIMDGGSSDKTVKVLQKYQKLVSSSKYKKKNGSGHTFIWRSEHDSGQTNAINKGLRASKGEILTYLNSDDTYEPGALKTIATYFQKNPRAYFVYGKGKLIDSKDKDIGMYNDFQVDTEKLHQSCGISQPTAFWRRKVFTDIGFFDESFHYTMDYDYWVRVSKKYKMKYLPQILANTRIHADAKTSSQTQKLYKDAIRVQKKHYSFVHHDWIFTYTDGMVHALKEGSLIEELWYWSVLFTVSIWLQLWWNLRLPTPPMRHQYRLWMVEMVQRIGHRLK